MSAQLFTVFIFFIFSWRNFPMALYDVRHSVTCQYYLLITCITFLYICRNIHAILESALKFVLFYTTSMIFIHFFFTEITLMSCLRAKPALKNQQWFETILSDKKKKEYHWNVCSICSLYVHLYLNMLPAFVNKRNIGAKVK